MFLEAAFCFTTAVLFRVWIDSKTITALYFVQFLRLSAKCFFPPGSGNGEIYIYFVTGNFLMLHFYLHSWCSRLYIRISLRGYSLIGFLLPDHCLVGGGSTKKRQTARVTRLARDEATFPKRKIWAKFGAEIWIELVTVKAGIHLESLWKEFDHTSVRFSFALVERRVDPLFSSPRTSLSYQTRFYSPSTLLQVKNPSDRSPENIVHNPETNRGTQKTLESMWRS